MICFQYKVLLHKWHDTEGNETKTMIVREIEHPPWKTERGQSCFSLNLNVLPCKTSPAPSDCNTLVSPWLSGFTPPGFLLLWSTWCNTALWLVEGESRRACLKKKRKNNNYIAWLRIEIASFNPNRGAALVWAWRVVPPTWEHGELLSDALRHAWAAGYDQPAGHQVKRPSWGIHQELLISKWIIGCFSKRGHTTGQINEPCVNMTPAFGFEPKAYCH